MENTHADLDTAPDVPPARISSSRKRLLAVTGVLVVLLAAVFFVATSGPDEGTPFRMVGSVQLFEPDHVELTPSGCRGTGEFADVVENTPVTVYDDAGSPVATGRLDSSEPVRADRDDPASPVIECSFTFVVEDVPGGTGAKGGHSGHAAHAAHEGGDAVLQVEVARRGKVVVDTYTAEAGLVCLTVVGDPVT
ncbi:hypothetical protein [Umezawaea beigongshangensis]|uniref:hypothetical protein n=1 Tax=Umezawaea beigongshangensis TaxID=2780383 RepID=UPI0018F2159A|nr:hypothetical protein [Umezawaea beigongshangensis]